MPVNARGVVMTIATGLAVHASSGSNLSRLSMPSPIARQGRAISESLLGIRFHMSRWQILRTLMLSAAAVAMVAMATVRKLARDLRPVGSTPHSQGAAVPAGALACVRQGALFLMLPARVKLSARRCLP